MSLRVWSNAHEAPGRSLILGRMSPEGRLAPSCSGRTGWSRSPRPSTRHARAHRAATGPLPAAGSGCAPRLPGRRAPAQRRGPGAGGRALGRRTGRGVRAGRRVVARHAGRRARTVEVTVPAGLPRARAARPAATPRPGSTDLVRWRGCGSPTTAHCAGDGGGGPGRLGLPRPRAAAARPFPACLPRLLPQPGRARSALPHRSRPPRTGPTRPPSAVPRAAARGGHHRLGARPPLRPRTDRLRVPGPGWPSRWTAGRGTWTSTVPSRPAQGQRAGPGRWDLLRFTWHDLNNRPTTCSTRSCGARSSR